MRTLSCRLSAPALALAAALTLLMGACQPASAPAAPSAKPPSQPAAGGPATGPAGVATAAPATSALTVPDNLRGGEIIVYSPFPDEQMQALSKGFADKSGIRVRNVVISTGETLARLKAEAANPQADFWLSVRPAIMSDALANNPPLIEDFKPRNAGEVKDVYQYPATSWLVGVGMYPLVIFYNERAVREQRLNVPATYQDLVDPAYAKKVVMPHPAASGTAYAAITTFVQVMGEERGWDYVGRLRQSVDQFTRSGRAPQNLVAQGEYPIGLGFYDAVYQLQQEGYPIGIAYPEPVFAEPYGAAVVKNAKNAERAKLYYEYLLTPEAQKVLTEYGNYSVRTDVPAPADARPLAQMNVLDYDWQRWAEQRTAVLDRFQAVTQAQPAGN
jgi:iron(III) transport system substrate-binding protein